MSERVSHVGPALRVTLAAVALAAVLATPAAASAAPPSYSAMIVPEAARLSAGATATFEPGVAIDGTTAVIGVDTWSQDGPGGGVAVYSRVGAVWVLQTTVRPPDAQCWGFGEKVALDGDTLLVAAPSRDWIGSVFVYTREGETWSLQAELERPDRSDEESWFGDALAIEGDTAVVADPDDWRRGWGAGAVHVYTRSVSTWSYQARLEAPGGHEFDGFGSSVGLSGDTLAVGEPWSKRSTASGTRTGGAAHVFTRSGAAWTHRARLTRVGWTWFGHGIDVEGDTLAVGAPWEDTGGATYIYRGSGATWTKEARLSSPNPDRMSDFGHALALGGDTVVVGEPRFPWDEVSGGAYVFAREGSTWSLCADMLADGGDGYYCGHTVAMSGDAVISGFTRSSDDPGGARIFSTKTVLPISRLGGTDRYGVSYNAARQAFYDADTATWENTAAIVACGEDRAAADCLSAAGLAGAVDAPLLLVRADATTKATTRALQEMTANRTRKLDRIYVMGGTASVSSAQLRALRAYAVSVVRIGGATRYDVARRAALEIKSRVGTPTAVMIANGRVPARFSEGLSAGPVCYAIRSPLLFTNGSSVPAATRSALAELGVAAADRYVVGGPASVPTSTFATLGGPTRISWASDRALLAADVARLADGKGWLDRAQVGIANRLPDALTGGVCMGEMRGALLYTDATGRRIPAATDALLADRAPDITRVYGFGGHVSVSRPALGQVGRTVW